MSNYNDTSKLPICDKHRHEVINHALREEVIPLTVGMKLEQAVETLRELLKVAKCPNCDGSGFTVIETGGVAEDGTDYRECEQVQCQWCYEWTEALKQTDASHD